MTDAEKDLPERGEPVETRMPRTSCVSDTSQLPETAALEEIVRDYVKRYRDGLSRLLHFFKIQPSFERAVEVAALAITPSGKRHAHQRRIPADTLRESARRLLAAGHRIRQCRSFEELHRVVQQTAGEIKGIGPLTVYDTALRLGAYVGFYPQKVFLHAGTTEGARRLGLNYQRRAVPMAELPSALQRLKPHEVEDLLCIYKNRLP